MSLTAKQLELVNLLKGTLPTAPAEVAQNNVDWYKQWQYGEKVNIGDRRWSIAEGSTEKILYEVYAEAGDNLYPSKCLQYGKGCSWKNIPNGFSQLVHTMLMQRAIR